MEERKIIIADYDENLRNVLAMAMESELDMKVVATTGNGVELLDLVRTHKPHVIVMDLILPWVDGISILETIQKETSPGLRPRILVLTKLNNEKIIHTAFSLGIDYYMLKPSQVQIVVDRIRQMSEIKDWIYEVPTSFDTKEVEPKGESLETQKENLERVVMQKISEMGIPHHVKGFRYLKTAIILCVQDMNRLNGITKDLYPSIAKLYNTTASRVERAIRHAIEVACSRTKETSGEEESLFLVGGKKPTNSEFIAFVADKIRMDLRIMKYK